MTTPSEELLFFCGQVHDYTRHEQLRFENALLHRTPEGDTLLHIAVGWHKDSVVRELLDMGADPNAPGDLARTPLHEAAEEGSETIVRLLLERGANPHARDSFGDRPSDLALHMGHSGIAALLK